MKFNLEPTSSVTTRPAGRSTLLLALLLTGCVPSSVSPPAPIQPNSSRAWESSTSTAPEAAVFRTWQEYLRSKPGGLAVNARTPSPLWVPDEQAKWPIYDLAGFYVPDGTIPEVIAVRPASPAKSPKSPKSPEYEIVIRFFVPDSTGAPRPSRIALTLSVYAAQESGRWLLANSLPRRTRTWYSETIGQITYFIEPGLAFNRSRARRAVAFVDSLAAAFEVPRLGPVDYYVTATVDGALHALGVDYPSTFGPGGGFAKPVNRQVFAAVPLWGEEYRHELAHLVLLPLLQGRTMTIVASEGLATWLGGTAGMTLRQATQSLRQHLTEHPAVTLDSALTPGGMPQAQAYAAGAVLCELLFRQGGTVALKQFLAAGPGPSQLRTALERLLQRPWDRILVDWRQAVDRLGGATAPPPNSDLSCSQNSRGESTRSGALLPNWCRSSSPVTSTSAVGAGASQVALATPVRREELAHAITGGQPSHNFLAARSSA